MNKNNAIKKENNITEYQQTLITKILESNVNRIINVLSERKKRKISVLRGEVWICDFGQNVGGEISGCRPCLIIQNNQANTSRTTIVFPFGKLNYEEANQIEITPSDIEISFGKLEGSVIVNQIKVVSKSRLGSKIAILTPFAMLKVENAMKKQLFV
jgi:mRNA interferase MazF